MTTLQAVALLVGLFFSLTGNVVAITSLLYAKRRNQDTDLKKVFEAIDGRFEKVTFSIDDIDGRVQQVEVKISPLWAMIERMCVDRLHHPITPEIDRLLDKYKHDWIDNKEPKQLSREEAQMLLAMIQDVIIKEKEAPIDAMAAFLLKGAIRTRYRL